jgi:ferredoxin/flavodoxin---NADP+ reductase
VGIAPIFPIARDLKEAGNTVISIIGARTKDLLFWEDKMRPSATSSSSAPTMALRPQGLVTVPLKEMLESERPIDHIVGPSARPS